MRDDDAVSVVPFPCVAKRLTVVLETFVNLKPMCSFVYVCPAPVPPQFPIQKKLVPDPLHFTLSVITVIENIGRLSRRRHETPEP